MRDTGGGFFGSRHFFCRDFLTERLLLLDRQMSVHGRVHRTESNGIDRDMAWGKLLCKRHRQAVDGALRCRISDFTGGTDQPPDRGDVQDTSPLVSYHIRNDSMAGVVDGSYIDAQDAVEFLRC